MCTRCWEEHCLCRDLEMLLFVLEYCCTASHKCQTRWFISSRMVNMVTLYGCSFVHFNLYTEIGKHYARLFKWWTNRHNNMVISQLVLSLSTLRFPPLIFELKPQHSVVLKTWDYRKALWVSYFLKHTSQPEKEVTVLRGCWSIAQWWLYTLLANNLLFFKLNFMNLYL